MEAAQRTLDMRALELAARMEQALEDHKREDLRVHADLMGKFAESKADRDAQSRDLKEAIRDVASGVDLKLEPIKSTLTKIAWMVLTGLVSSCVYLLITYVLPHPGPVTVPTHAVVMPLEGLDG